jgi:hypothetical protein
MLAKPSRVSRSERSQIHKRFWTHIYLLSERRLQTLSSSNNLVHRSHLTRRESEGNPNHHDI